MTYRVLDPALVLRLYKERMNDGTASCENVAKDLADLGVKVPWTGRPPSRQAVWNALRKTEEGRRLVGVTRDEKWKK